MPARVQIIGLALVLVIVAALFTFPLIAHFSEHTPAGDESGDQYQSMWFFSWMKTALLAGKNPYWTNSIYFPQGTGLAYHLSPSTNLLALIVATVTGAPIESPFVFNFLLFGTFVVCGIAAYLIVREVSGSSTSALWASLIVAFSPYRMWNLNHLNLLSLGWGFLTVYLVMRAIRQASARLAVSASGSFAVLFYASLSDALFTIFLLALYLLFSSRELLASSSLRRTALVLLTFTTLSACLIAPGLWQLKLTGSSWNQNWSDLITFSADLRAFILPPAGTTILSDLLQVSHSWDSGNGPDVFLGWLLPILVVITLIWRVRDSSISLKWLGMGFLFALLSLGPSLRVTDEVYLDGLMPYRVLFESVPYLGLSRTPHRFIVLAHFCLVVFSAQGVTSLWNRWSRALGSRFLRGCAVTGASVILIIVLRIETTPYSTKLWRLEIPEVYGQMAADSSVIAVLELPVSQPGPLHNKYMYWQAIHGHPIVNGYLTHASPGASELQDLIKTWDSLHVQGLSELGAMGVTDVLLRDPAAPDGPPKRISRD